MTRILMVLVGVLGLAAAVASGTYQNAAEARDAVFAAEGALAPEDRAVALELLKREWKRAPSDAENLYALVRVCADSNEWETGLPAARALAKLGPDVAEYQYMLGNALFATIDQVSFINKGARAKAGLKAYKNAVELDPGHLGARQGLFFFYMEAPGIAGGSLKKAEEIASAMAAEPEHASDGYALLLQLAAKKEDWEKYQALLPKVLDKMSTDEERAQVLLTSAYATLFQKKDFAAGLDLAHEYRRYAGEGQGGYMSNYLEGIALHGLGRFGEAKDKLAAVLGVLPEARNTRFLMAECCEKTGDRPGAAAQYAAFAERFPKDDRAKKARKKAKKLAKD